MPTLEATPTTIKACDIPPKERHTTILGTFDKLAPGEKFILVVDHPPTPLLYVFQKERKGLFEWTPLEEGPESWRVEILRRDAEIGALRGVTEALSWDHDRLDAIESGAFADRAAGRFDAAREAFQAFAKGLRRHIRFEEEILFPVFEQRAGMSSRMGPTAVMRSEHLEILRLLDAIADEIGRAGSSADALRRQIHVILGDHNAKEEEILYPGTDRMLTEAESDDVVARIQAMASPA